MSQLQKYSRFFKHLYHFKWQMPRFIYIDICDNLNDFLSGKYFYAGTVSCCCNRNFQYILKNINLPVLFLLFAIPTSLCAGVFLFSVTGFGGLGTLNNVGTALWINFFLKKDYKYIIKHENQITMLFKSCFRHKLIKLSNNDIMTRVWN